MYMCMACDASISTRPNVGLFSTKTQNNHSQRSGSLVSKQFDNFCIFNFKPKCRVTRGTRMVGWVLKKRYSIYVHVHAFRVCVYVCCVGINVFIFAEHLAIYICVRESVWIYVVCVYMCTSCIEKELCYSEKQREREIHAHTHIHAKTHTLSGGTPMGWLRLVGSLNL